MEPSYSSAVLMHVLEMNTTLPLLIGLEQERISLQPIGRRRSVPVRRANSDHGHLRDLSRLANACRADSRPVISRAPSRKPPVWLRTNIFPT